jgi:hypothetical protein
MDNGDRILGELLSGQDPDGTSAYKLLQEVFNGYPATRLRGLIHSNEPVAVEAGSWVLGEISDATSYVDEIPFLLSHSIPGARMAGIGLALDAPADDTGQIVASVAQLLADSEAAVRRKAMRFLSVMSPEQLVLAGPYLDREASQLIAWLAGCVDATDCSSEIALMLEDPRDMVRRVAAVAASRLAARDATALREAAASVDPDLNSFATFELRQMEIRRQARQ